MKKFYISLIVVITLCALMSITSPVNDNYQFIINANALSETSGFEQISGDKHQDNIDSITNATQRIQSKLSQKITENTEVHGAGRSYLLPSIELQKNIVQNIGFEEEYVEKIVTTDNLEVPPTSAGPGYYINEVGLKFKLKYPSNILDDFDPEASNVTYMGNYKLTAYCYCEECNGKWGRNRKTDEEGCVIAVTATGARAYANHTIAVDPRYIPYGSIVVIERNGVYYKYVAEDCGGGIKNQRIDVYFDSHVVCNDFGVRYGNVYVVKPYATSSETSNDSDKNTEQQTAEQPQKTEQIAEQVAEQVGEVSSENSTEPDNMIETTISDNENESFSQSTAK